MRQAFHLADRRLTDLLLLSSTMKRMPTRVRSHAKINLGLGIGAPRADGFHALSTVYQTLELHDVVTVTARPTSAPAVRLTSNDARVPTDARNTAWKMVSLALEGLKLTAEVSIHIEKRLPVQGGLGAGSANAAAALVGLEAELGIADESPAFPPFEQTGASSNRSSSMGERKALEGWGTRRLWQAERLKIAAQVGSDVPLFLIGGTVLGLDRGQDVYPLPDVESVWCVVAVPAIGVSTPQAFRDWDALCATEGLTAEASTDKLNELSRAYASAFAGAIPRSDSKTGSSGVVSDRDDLAGLQESALVRTGITSWIQNDFERVVFPQHPSLREIKRILLGTGTPEAALYASLSGSGSALFGLYLTRGDAEAACERLRRERVQSHLTRTLPRSDYWGNMLS
jgi:4-diphosphocytidyl-2-C-methyl-D-erythritol kinase